MNSTPAFSDAPRVRTLVTQRIEQLQERFLKDSSTARALLAQLRSAASRPPGSVPAVWELTSFPVSQYVSDSPTFEENAVHDAMILYAIAQQGNSRGVHRRSESGSPQGFGDAMTSLARQQESNHGAVQRRFSAAATSESYDELVRHVRPLIRQLSNSDLNITLDFGLLADDFLVFQSPDGPQRIRRRWARQFNPRPVPDATAA